MKQLSLICCIFFLTATAAFAQLTSPGGSATTQPVPSITGSLPDRSAPTLSQDAMIFDGAVDPNEYRLGPGDILQYRSWTNNDAQLLMVSADVMLMVPRIGPFSAKGKTLAQIQQEVGEAVEKGFQRKAGSDKPFFSLTLTQPRRIMVNILGQVELPGAYAFTGGTRAAFAVAVANKPSQHTSLIGDQAFQREEEKRKREADRLKPYLGEGTEKVSSLRNIIVSHADGTTDRVDLFRFNGTHDPRFSPLLREGDVVYVPYKKANEGMVGVYGAIRSPGDYEFVMGDSLWQIIRSAFGPSDNADLSKVELVRMNPDGSSIGNQTIDCNAIRAGAASDVALQSGDRIFVRDHPDLRELSRVIVKGEVAFPGVYPIGRSNTKLSDVIKIAGGFTPYAFIGGGTVTRKRIDIDNKDIMMDDERKLVGRLSNLEVEDTANFRAMTESRQGYVAVDMHQLFEKNNASADITLRDGDVVSIPPASNSVYVWGYVGSLGYIPYQPGWKVDDYIAAAGGYAEGAEKSRTRVIKARTRKWAEPDKTIVEAGDEIYIPKEATYPEGYSLQKVAIIVGILTGVLYAVSIVVALRK